MVMSGVASGRRPPRARVREILSPAEAQAEYPRVWEVADVPVPGLTDDELGRVVSLVVDTCPAGYGGHRRCRCRWRPGRRGRPARRVPAPEEGVVG